MDQLTAPALAALLSTVGSPDALCHPGGHYASRQAGKPASR